MFTEENIVTDDSAPPSPHLLQSLGRWKMLAGKDLFHSQKASHPRLFRPNADIWVIKLP